MTREGPVLNDVLQLRQAAGQVQMVGGQRRAAGLLALGEVMLALISASGRHGEVDGKWASAQGGEGGLTVAESRL